MVYRRALVCALVALAALPAAAQAAFPPDGKRWRQLTETVGVTRAQVASMCPSDGASRCSGAYEGWIWATDAQVITLMGAYSPDLLTADPPAVGGAEHLFQGITFLEDMKPTFFFSGYVDTTGFTSGWTADGNVASAGYTYPYFNGSLGVGAATDDEPSRFRGAWLWRPSTDDLTAPVIRPVVSGTQGTGGWYTSDVAVSWDVSDPDSAVSASDCAPASVTADTAGTTFTCHATSGGGTSSASVTITRDATPPVLTCDAAPTFELFQFAQVTAAISDATAGAPPTTSALATTSTAGSFAAAVTATDRAGNRASTTCAYRVTVPTCNGKTPTIIGTAANNTITGTPGPDVIIGLGGADTIKGAGGNDTICGGDGNDNLEGGDGDDHLNGDAGTDSIRGDSGRDTCLSGETRTSSCET